MSALPSPFTVVLASAGTGKTFRLTNHYLRLVVRGYRGTLDGAAFDPASILATTFTRKAAGEIVERVFARLLAGAVDSEQLLTLRKFVDPALTADECERLIAFLAERLHRINILTIDALLARMAGSIGMELGLPLGWKIVDEARDASLREEAIGTAIREAGRAQVETLLRLVYAGGFGRSVRGTIARQINAGFDAFVRTGRQRDLWWTKVEGVPEPNVSAIRLSIDQMRLAPQMSKPVEAIMERFGKRDWTRCLDGKVAGAVLAGGGDFYKKAIDPALIAALQPVVRFAGAQFLAELAGRNRAALELICRFDDAYSEIKMRTGSLRFDDVPRGLLSRPLDDLLTTLYFRMDSSVRHLLLDEFQDTSVDQFRVLEPIIDEMVAHRESERTVLVVGDEKQSLYGWRGAKSRLLSGLTSRWGAFKPIPLVKSQRSSPVVLDAVNAVFDRASLSTVFAADAPATAAAESFGTSFLAHSSAKTGLAGEVTLVQVQALPDVPGERMSAVQHTHEVVAEAVRRVAEIVNAAPDASVAILTRANRPIANIIYQLRQLGIEASGEGGTPVTDAPIVAAAMAGIRLAVHPGDTASLALLAGSPIGPALDLSAGMVTRFAERRAAAHRVSQGLRERIGRDGIAGVLRWFQRLGAPHTDPRGFERFEQLLDLAERFEGLGGTDANEFAETVEGTLLEDASPARVRVMTVHKAKGLEFDAVVLIGLDRNWTVDHTSVLTTGKSPPALAGPLDPVTLVSLCPGKEARAACGELGGLHDAAKYEAVSAELCCLYVGMTRARAALHMVIGPLPKSGESPRASKIVFSALAEDEDPQFGEARREVFSIATPVDWRAQLKPRATLTALEPVPALRLVAATNTGQRVALRAPSSMEGGAGRRLAEILRIEPQRGRKRGTVLHALFEGIGWSEDGPLNDDDLRSRIRGVEKTEGPAGLSDAELSAEFRKGWGPATRAALSRTRYAGKPGTLELRREYPVAAKLTGDNGEVLIVRGAVDRLVIGVEGGRPVWAEILDFKTDAVDPGRADEFAARVAHYVPQVEAYIRTIGASLCLEARNVSAALLFVSSDSVVPVTLAAVPPVLMERLRDG